MSNTSVALHIIFFRWSCVKIYSALQKGSEDDGRSLSQHILNFLLSYHATPHSTTNQALCSLFLNRTIRTRLSLVYPDTEHRVLEKQADQETQHSQHAKTRHFSVGQPVMARNVRSGNKWVPGVVKKQLGPLVEVEQGILWKHHIDHLHDRQTDQTTVTASDDQPILRKITRCLLIRYT